MANGILLRANMLIANDFTITQSAADGKLTLALKDIAQSKITGLTTTLTGLNDRIDALEAGTIDLTAYTSATNISLTATTTFALAGTGNLTWNGKNVVVADDLDAYQLLTGKNAANGYVGLNASSKFDANYIPIDTATLEISGGTLKVKTAPVVNTFTATAVASDIPTIEGGGVPEVGDMVAVKSDVATYGGSVYYRVASSTGKFADDYILMSYKFDPNMDNMTQGTTNKFLSAAQYTIVSKLSDSSGNLAYDSKVLFHAANLNVVKSAEFTGTGATGSALTLAAGGVAFAKMVQTGAVPTGWSMAATQLTGTIDAARLPSAVVTGVTASATIGGTANSDVFTASAVAANSTTLAIKFSGDFSVSGTSTNSVIALKDGIAFSKLVQSGATPTGWTVAASQITSGTLAAARIPAAGTAVASKGAVYVAANTGLTVSADGGVSLAVVTGDTITGDGKATATKLEVNYGLGLNVPSSGTYSGKLSANIEAADGTITIGENAETAAVTVGVVGSAITGLNASNLATGTVPLARLSDATVSAKGIASFATANFTVSSGAVSLKAATATTLGGVKVAAATTSGITLGADGALSLAVVKGTGLSGAGTSASPLAVDTATIATKDSVNTLQTQVDKLDQQAIPFTTASNTAPAIYTSATGVLKVTATRIPRGICKEDYTNLMPIFPEAMTAPNAQGQSVYDIDLNGITLTGNWLVVF